MAFAQPCDTSQHLDIPIFDDMSFCPQAQQAADADNFHTAYQHIQSALPVAALTPECIEQLKCLYPPHTPYTPPGQTTCIQTHEPMACTHKTH